MVVPYLNRNFGMMYFLSWTKKRMSRGGAIRYHAMRKSMLPKILVVPFIHDKAPFHRRENIL